MKSAIGTDLPGLVVLATGLFILVSAIRFTAPLLTRYTRALVGGYGFGKQPRVADLKRTPAKQPKDDHEPAYDHYLRGQAWRDVRHAQLLGLQAFWEILKKYWTGILDKYMRTRVNENLPPLLQRPIRHRVLGSALLASLGLGTFLAAVVLTVSGAAHGLLLGVLFVLTWGVTYALRVTDNLVSHMRGITKTCKNCGQRLVVITYECDKCHARHGNLRPGRYGTLSRYCTCGNKLPTLALRKRYELPGWCPACDKPLAKWTGKSPEIVLPVFGAPMAGKTQLITVLLMALEVLVERAGGKMDCADDSTRAQVKKSRQDLAGNRTTSTAPINTATGTLVHPASSFNVEPKRGQPRQLHVFDAAGETFRKERDIEQLVYLKHARTFIFVIDPLSIEQLWLGIDAQQQGKLASKRATDEPHVVFVETLQTVTRMGIDTKKVRLAVAVSKADLVADLIQDIDARDSKSIRTWLLSWDQEPLVRAMDLHFEQVSFFLTSATIDSHQRADASVAAFAGQTLTAEGLPLQRLPR